MNIFDAHTHIASWFTIEESEKNLLDGMDRKNVLFSLISHADCSSFPSEGTADVPPLSAEEGLRQCLDFAKRHPGRIYVAVWVKPRVEKTPSPELIRLIEENLDLVKAIKFHPYCERLPADSPLMEPYYELARRFHLPVLIHTALDMNSAIVHFITAAEEHPDLRFVAAHLELGSDHRFSIRAIRNLPNAYCDTAWVDLESALLAMETMGEDRVIFGTDAPIEGESTLDNPVYEEYFANADGPKRAKMAKLLFQNGVDFYQIPHENK